MAQASQHATHRRLTGMNAAGVGDALLRGSVGGDEQIQINP
jgi:hypothetical protein